MQVMAAINRSVSRYRWVSSIAPYRDSFFVFNHSDRMQTPADELWEHEAVRELLTAFPRLGIGDRPYIRRCESEKCQKWFFAPRGDKRTCSPACHVYANRSPDQRFRKAKYMRDLRKELKERRDRENKRLGFTKGKRRVVSNKSR
jgi:hypothetical protein